MKVPRLPDDIVGLIIDELATVLVSESRDEAEKDACARDLAACARTAYNVRIVIVDVMVMAGRPPFRIERYMVATAVANLLRIAPNVTTLSVKVCYPDDALFFLQPLYLVLQGSKPALRNLGIMVLHRNHITQPITSLFLDISQLFPELNGLQLSGIPFGGVAGSVNPAPFKLRTLSFDADGQGDGSDDVFKWVTGQSLQSMEHLELYGQIEPTAQVTLSDLESGFYEAYVSWVGRIWDEQVFLIGSKGVEGRYGIRT
ncbi:hypothetical protein RQP46_005260 [Phenoliferia psychrophenolica]